MNNLLPSFESILFSIFTRGSTTYSISSLFFPKRIRHKVSAFYAFVRVIDNIVDENPIQELGFYKAKQTFYEALEGKETQYLSIANFAELVHENNIPLEYIDAFFDSMEWDLQPHFTIDTMDKCLWYIYGSAEVIGNIMSILCEISEHLSKDAGKLGRAMQYVNFIRDIAEDGRKKRRYIPLINTSLSDLSYTTAYNYKEEFFYFIRTQLMQYIQWVDEVTYAISQLPLFIRIPILTATDLYSSIALKVFKNPMLIFGPKIHSKKHIALSYGLYHGIIKREKLQITPEVFEKLAKQV